MISESSNLKSTNEIPPLARGKSLKECCYHYSIRVIKLITTLPKERPYWILGDQLLRSATSIGANITEAKSASSKKDFIKFYEIALKSANETEYWLGLLKDALGVSGAEMECLLRETGEISRINAASVLTLKNKR